MDSAKLVFWYFAHRSEWKLTLWYFLFVVNANPLGLMWMMSDDSLPLILDQFFVVAWPVGKVGCQLHQNYSSLETTFHPRIKLYSILWCTVFLSKFQSIPTCACVNCIPPLPFHGEVINGSRLNLVTESDYPILE